MPHLRRSEFGRFAFPALPGGANLCLAYGAEEMSQASGLLQLGADEQNLVGADVFDRMRRERRRPLRDWVRWRWPDRAAIEEQIAVTIAADKIALPGDVDRGGPTMRVHGYDVARRDANFEDADEFIFK